MRVKKYFSRSASHLGMSLYMYVKADVIMRQCDNVIIASHECLCRPEKS